MSYELRIHDEIRDWLIDLRATEPELARTVGEAVLAMLDAPDSLGPPLVVPLESVLRPPDDPRGALEGSYQRQLDTRTKVRRGVVDMATSRKRVELQVSQLEQIAAKLADQRDIAVKLGREDLASRARIREAGVQEQLSELRRQLLVLPVEEENPAAASQRLLAKIDELLQESPDFAPISHGASGPRDQDSVPVQAGVMELRPGVPDHVQVGLLFVVEPQDAVVLVAYVENPGGSPDEYQEVLRIAAGRLAIAQSARPPAAAASLVAFVSYDAESFLDEFFPGEGTEVKLGAAALVATNRALTEGHGLHDTQRGRYNAPTGQTRHPAARQPIPLTS